MTLFFLFLLTLMPLAAADTPLYKDASQPVEARVKDLLGRMTIEEKLGQLNMPCVYLDSLVVGGQPQRRQRIADEGTLLLHTDEADMAGRRDGARLFTRGSHPAFKSVGPGGGFFDMANRVLPVPPREIARLANGEQGGTAVADVLWGDYNPSGRLPITYSAPCGTVAGLLFLQAHQGAEPQSGAP